MTTETSYVYRVVSLDQQESGATIQRYLDEASADGWTFVQATPKFFIFSKPS